MDRIENKKGVSFYSIFVIIYCMLIIYFFPISSNIDLSISKHADVYYYFRLALLPFGIWGLVQYKKRNAKAVVEYMLLLFMLVLTYTINGEIQLTGLLVFVGIVTFDSIYENEDIIQLPMSWTKCIVVAFMLQLMVMCIVFYRTNGYFGIISTSKDSNYTGFFLIVLYYILGNENDQRIIQKRDCLLVLSIFTYSRTAMIAVALIIVFRIFKIKINWITQHPLAAFVAVFAVWIVICELFVSYFSSIDYVYEYHSGLNRFSTLVDDSNNTRALINVNIIENLSLKTFFLGYTDEEYSSIVYIGGKTTMPHNLLLTIFVQNGIIFAIAVIRRFASMFHDVKNVSAMYIIFLLYAMILGPSTYYCVDMILILTAVKLQEEKHVSTKN